MHLFRKTFISLALLPTLNVFANESLQVEEVLVNGHLEAGSLMTSVNQTGSRLGMSALETPATIQIVSEKAIQRKGDTNIVSAATRVAGITSQARAGSGGFGFAARGFASASVTMLYDGTKSLINTGSQTYPYDTWNVERIEVLNGPASVLYGGGAIGAAINVVPRKPSSLSSHTFRVGAASNNTYSAAIDSTGPVHDSLAYRFSASQLTSDGFVQRGDSEGFATSAALAWTLSESLALTLTADYGNRDQTVYLGMPLIDGKADRSLREVNYATRDSKIPFEDYRVTAQIDWQAAENIKVRHVSTYIRGERLWHYPARFIYRSNTNDIEVSGFGSFEQHQDQYSNYTDFVWNHALFGLDHTLSAGIEYVSLSNDRYVDNYPGTIVTDLYNRTPGVFPNSTSAKNYQETLANQYAVFIEDKLELRNDLSLVTGIRFDHSDVERINLVDNSNVEKTFSPTSWRAGLVYEVAPNFNVYGQYSTAFDPVSTLCCISAAQLNYAMSEGKQIEAGVKQILRNGEMEWSLAAYKIEKDNLLTSDPVNIGQSLQVGSQSAQGIEGTFSAKLAKQWSIELNGTVLEAKYDDFSENVGGVIYQRDGNHPINTPRESANLWLMWDFLPQWSAQTGVRYVGESFVNSDNSQRLPSYRVFDAGLRWEVADGIAVQLRAKNIFDEFYAYTSVANGLNSGQWELGAPRTYEIDLMATF